MEIVELLLEDRQITDYVKKVRFSIRAVVGVAVVVFLWCGLCRHSSGICKMSYRFLLFTSLAIFQRKRSLPLPFHGRKWFWHLTLTRPAHNSPTINAKQTQWGEERLLY
jgi:hypothetical protein